MPNISKINLPDGVTYDLVATASDTKVTQTATSTNANYEVLFSNSANNTTETAEARKSEGLLFNPSKSAFTIGSRESGSTIGVRSCSAGYLNIASGTDSFAEGYTTQANGDYSHSEGRDTTSNGDYSHSQGYSTSATHRSQFVFGEYSILDDSTATASQRGKYVEIVGNGDSSARSNARTLDWSGNQWIAGNYQSDALTASKLLVSDANKNIVSSNLAVSDLITTSNIGSQRVERSDYLQSVQTNGTAYNNAFLLRSRYNKWSDRRFGLEIINNNSETTTYGVRVDYATSAGTATNNILKDGDNGSAAIYWKESGFGDKFQIKPQFSGADDSNYLAINGAVGGAGTDPSLYELMRITGKTGKLQVKGDIYYSSGSRRAVGSYTDNTFFMANELMTFKSSNTAIVTGGKGNYIWGISSWSDSRLKKNIKDSQVNALDIINKIQMREFDFKDEKFGTHKDIGYVAQELMNVIPDCVEEVELPDEDKEKYGIDSMYQVEDKHLIPYLVKAIQEQQRQIDDMQKQIDELKDTIKTLTV